MDRTQIQKELLRRYLLTLAPAVVLFAVWAVYRNIVKEPQPVAPGIIGPGAFIAAIATAVALPLFLRDRFVKQVAKLHAVAAAPFLAFEKALMSLALSSAYFAAAAYISSAPLFHFSGSFLAALYAAYYYYPTKKRVANEMQLFRVSQEPGGE